MKLTHVFINRSLPAIAAGGQMPIKMFAVGTACNASYGGGVITSIAMERNGAIVVRKDRPFTMPAAAGVKATSFDFVVILPGGEYAYGVDEPAGEQSKGQAQQPKGK
jgi:hypothetical protein